MEYKELLNNLKSVGWALDEAINMVSDYRALHFSNEEIWKTVKTINEYTEGMSND